MEIPGTEGVWGIAWAPDGESTTSAPEPKESAPTHVVLVRSLPGMLQRITNPSVSHDGRMVAFISATDETSGLYLRRLDEFEPRYVENTEGAGWVTFSHDDQWLAYFDTAKRRIVKISIHGGPPTILADPGYLPFDWRADGSLYLSLLFIHPRFAIDLSRPRASVSPS